MNIFILLKPTETTDISHLIKKPQTEDNQFLIDFNSALTSRTKCSSSFSLNEINYKPKNIEIKLSIANYLDIRPDLIQLYNRDNQGTLIELKDKATFDSSMLNNFKETQVSSPIMVAKFNSGRNKSKVMLYFSLSTTIQHKIIIDFFNHNIEKMIFDVSSQCSVYLLKHMISQKTSNLILKENQILYSAGLVPESPQLNVNTSGNSKNLIILNKMYTNKSSTSHKLEDDTSVSKIIDYYNEKNGKQSNPNESCILSLIFAEKNKDKYQIGLNFSFNIMRTSNKVSFDESAPEYREVSDGLNLFSYCYNNNCGIYKEMFTSQIGYGQFDIIKLCKIIYCPICKDKNKHEVKNIGMVNSQWKYKGFLNGAEASKCEGDGFTIDNQLYVLSEINIVKQFNSLLIEIKHYSTLVNSINAINNHDDLGSQFEDLDAIDLYTPNKEKFDKISNLSEIKLNTPLAMNGIVQDKRIVNVDSDHKIVIDPIDKEICVKCTGVDTITKCIIY